MGISLRSLLIIPWVVPLIGLTGLVGWQPNGSRQSAIDHLATEFTSARFGHRGVSPSGPVVLSSTAGALVVYSPVVALDPGSSTAARQSVTFALRRIQRQTRTFSRLAASDRFGSVTPAAAWATQDAVGGQATGPRWQAGLLPLVSDRPSLPIPSEAEEPGLDGLITSTGSQLGLSYPQWRHLQYAVVGAELALLSAIGVGIWLTRRTTRRTTQSLEQRDLAISSAASADLPSPQPLFSPGVAMIEGTDAPQPSCHEIHRDYARALEAEIAARTRDLENTTQQLREAQRLARVGSWELAVATAQLTWSDEMFRLFDRDVRLGSPAVEEVYEYLAPADRDALQAAVARAIATGQPYQLEQCLRRPDGSRRYIMSRGEAQRNAQGQVVYLLGTAADITERKLAELALAESEEKRRLALDLTNTGSWEFEVATGQARWSESHYRLMGLTPEIAPANYETWRDRVHPEDLPTTEQAFEAAIANHTLLIVEYRVVHLDRQVRWVLTKGQAIYADDGTPLRMVGVMMDISDRKQAEAERDQAMLQLQQSEANYLAILEHQTELITRFRPDGTLLFVNQAFCEYYGVQKDDVIGKSYQPLIYPDDQAAIDQGLASLSPQNLHVTIEHRVVVQGQVRWMQWINRAIYDAQGHLNELQSVGRDIHDRKQAEAALRASQAQYQRLVDDIGEKFVVFSHTGMPGILTYVSDGVESVFGLRRGDVMGKTWNEVVNWLPEALDRAYAAIAAMQEVGDDFQQFEMSFIHPNDRTTRTIFVSQHPVRDCGGHLMAIEGIVEDITDRKRADQELQRLNAKLQALATTDSLTHVANRRQFLATLAKAWSRHQRERLPLALIMLDIDHFKAFNDTYGHPAGDRCLTQMAGLLAGCMRRPGDLVARYGGEEFIILLPNTAQAGAIAIAQAIQQQLADLALPHAASPTAPCVTVSLGIAVVNMPTAEEVQYDTAIACADQMLYAAKHTRNTYQVAVIDQRSPLN